ncbi:hypothetical protein EH223_15000 [candidate division KSB1 bacterium]|nr:lamin tail domain-containing protein [candidate division KSB1 bacterium]RQW01471.1 MAG: hypothetical protein EH223_15000 [candidate division KSB1 bacterium]
MQNRMLILLYCVIYLRADAQVILSEIMFNPAGNERTNEYVELYNAGKSESVDLLGWLLSDGTKFSTILPFEESSILHPGQHAIVLVPQYFDESNAYDSVIPEDALILTIDKSQFGAYGFKNSESECVSLHQPDTLLIASYCYTPDNADGFSEEKRKMSADDSEVNWSNSLISGGTPGYQNSVTPLPFDLGLSSFAFSPQRPSTQDTIFLRLTITNMGDEPIDSCTIIFQDSADIHPHPICEKAIVLNSLPAGDSIKVRHKIGPLSAGLHTLHATIDCALDEKLLNNHSWLSMIIFETYAPRSVVFNEIMYDTDEKSDEWLEIYNASSRPVDLKNWHLKDRKKIVMLTSEQCILNPGDYCLLANRELNAPKSCQQIVEGKLPELNNTGDELTLTDAVGVLIDSVAYEQVHGGGRYISLERIRIEDESTLAANWGSCLAENGSTPGSLNSISPREYDAAIRGPLHLDPSLPMSGDEVLVSFEIVNSGRSAIQDIKTNISYHAINDNTVFDIGDNTVAFLSPRQSALTTIAWHNVPSGVYVLHVELRMPLDMDPANNRLADSVTVSYQPGSLVINEIMYSPAHNECEWIELCNKNHFPIEMMTWCMSDDTADTPVLLSSNPTPICPGEFVLISHDSTVQSGEAIPLVCSQLPSFSNDYDDVILYDGNGRVIDHVHYASAWGGTRGHSLERINPEVNSNEPSNWTTCVDPVGHTAGLVNSVYIKSVPQSTSVAVSPDPFSPDGDGHDDHVAISYEIPGAVAHVNIKIFDINGRLVRFLLNNSPSGAKRTVYWNGHNDEGTRCRMGIYIILFEALNETRMCIEHVKKTVVLAGDL